MGNSKLSALQRRIILDVARGELGAERTRRGKWCPSDRAVFSRTLSRLEARGLVVIEHKRGRAARVCLTDCGREIAEDLSGAHLPSIAELQAQGARVWQTYEKQLDQARTQTSTYRLEKLFARAFPSVPLKWHAVALAAQGKRPRTRRRGVRTRAGILAGL